MDQIDVEDQSVSQSPWIHEPGNVEDQNNSHMPTLATEDASRICKEAQDETRSPHTEADLIFDVFVFVISTVCLIILFPVVLVYCMLCMCFSSTFVPPKYWFKSKGRKINKGIYEKMMGFEPTKNKLHRLCAVAAVRLGCVTLLWLVLNLSVPSLKRKTLFGTLLWKCSLFTVVILLGKVFSEVLVAMICHTIVKFLNARRVNEIKFFVLGLQRSFTSLLYFGLLLALWLVYFHTDNGLDPSPSTNKYGTWTLVSLLVREALGVLKRAVLLQWEANAIFKRFKERILIAGFRLFFLSLILDDFEQPPLDRSIRLTELMEVNGDKNMLRKDVTLFQLKMVALRLTRLAEVTRREDDAMAEIIRKCEDNIQSDHRCWEDIEQEPFDSFASMFGKMRTRDVTLLLNEVRAKHPSKGITCEITRTWMVDAHNDCLLVGYTLNDAFAVVSVLDMVLSCCIVVVVILFWLLATGLAATNVLITIGSISIALSFMFGDTCKAFFQGVIFSFVTHPFDIGDRCIIDGVEVEVKRIGILTTTCLKIGTAEKMLYPSSELSTKLIINLESDPDPTDLIEMVFDQSTKSDQLESVRKKIEEFIDGDTHRSYEKYHQVVVKEMGCSIMMSVRFKHILNAEDMTHTKRYEKKIRQRYQLFIKMKKFLEDQHTESHL